MYSLIDNVVLYINDIITKGKLMLIGMVMFLGDDKVDYKNLNS